VSPDGLYFSNLKVLQKFLDGELPELDVTLKKEINKRKSEGGSGLGAKRVKIGLEEIKKESRKIKRKKKKSS